MKFISLLLLCYLALIVQLGLVPEWSIAGSRPNLPVVVLCLALFWLRDAQVFVWAVLTGLVCETFDTAVPGTGVLLLTGLVWVAYRIQVQFELRSLVSRCTVMTLMVFAYDILFPLLNGSTLKSFTDLVSLAQPAAGNAVYTTLSGLILLLVFKLAQSLLPFPGKPGFADRGAYASRFSH